MRSLSLILCKLRAARAYNYLLHRAAIRDIRIAHPEDDWGCHSRRDMTANCNFLICGSAQAVATAVKLATTALFIDASYRTLGKLPFATVVKLAFITLLNLDIAW